MNLQELSNKWQYFIKKEANSIPFFNELKARSPETIEDFIKNGYKEFSNSEELSTVLSKNLFYHILLEANSFEKSNFDIIQNSQLFPNILLKINVVKSMISEDEDFTTYRLVGSLMFNKLLERKGTSQARYRTKQINIIKINDVISAHSAIKCDYLLSLDRGIGDNTAIVRLDDSVYNFYTKGSEALEDFVRASDTVKRELIYKVGNHGEIIDLLNIEEIQQNWHRFKKQLPMNPIFRDAKADVLQNIINTGNTEYNSKEILLNNSASNLFNKIIFSQYLTKSSEKFRIEEFETQSHFFPEIKFQVECETKLRSEDDKQFHYAKRGKIIFVDVDRMILLYEERYREQIEFKFTNYLYDFNVNFSVSKIDGLINNASVNIDERIKNNMQSEILYELKRVEL